ncbi:MAG: hypothetical protein V2I57_13820 [Xanthomonadales bacterium]|nr:hypothetical protein [Xanthomonadales bacterium]
MRNLLGTPPRLLLCGLAALAAATLSPGLAAQEDAPRPAKIFTDDRVIAARVEGPWKTIMRRKEDETTWEGVFHYTEPDGREISIPIEITTRGLTRKRVCDFPPLRFKFDKEAARGTAFRGAGSLKLVTHCLFNNKYEQYIIKEYLAYRAYNAVTEKSYRVQGLDLSYADDPDDTRPIERFGFLIEDPDDVAERNGLEKLSINDIEPSRLDATETSRFMLFQYLVANLDWSALGGPTDKCCHNARLIGAGPEADNLVAIPYDLDSSGLVNAHYAAPPDGLKVRNVTQRLYRGFCVHNDTVDPTLDEFRRLRPEFIALLENEPRLDKGNRKRALKFLDGFYEDLETPKDVERRLIDNCRG